MSDYLPVIGLEIHAQLLTETKLFCACPAEFGSEPNTNVCPVCLGLPGALPVVNEKAVEYAIKVGLATGCSIASRSVFARKNYFYPDCPKNYQITQYEKPLCTDGLIVLGGTRKKVRIKRIHLEEDAGKLIHAEKENVSIIDMNRAGVPLVEIVTEPDIGCPADAVSFMQQLRSILRYLNICDGNMEEGSLRCDINVSVRDVGSVSYGVKTEIKNLNSFKAVEHALGFEIARQEKVRRRGGTVVHSTLLWDPMSGKCHVMRSKEAAHDYRYFPEPDLPVLEVSDALIAHIGRELPELPRAKEERFVRRYGLPRYDAQLLTGTREIADYFEDTVRRTGDPKATSNWIMGEVLRELNERKIGISDCRVTPSHLATIIDLVASAKINMSMAKKVFKETAKSGTSPDDVIAREGLLQIADEKVLLGIIERVLDRHSEQVAQYKDGKEQLLRFFVGQVMKESRGKAHPQIAETLLEKTLEERGGR